ncbi:ATP-binding protein [Streptomyces zagrosensis]|uniref:ORC1/DEAH AAA+ ATPase domain-containing protein n=1 Tax=Streptomyces zagrosensis TaxID=1042984 RepID=A0A7W9QIE4_9ACTN|nr:ATP-binding protein [Streptomyces zagrosensis]MBB5940318.1 hypothetical protein [Streptomyces zagrosensis]
MTKNRMPRPLDCSDEMAYPVFPAEESVGGADTKQLNDALKELAAALTAVPDAFEPAITDLTPSDIGAVLNAMPVMERKHALGALRIPLSGDKVNGPLCRDVLARLRQDTASPRVRHALRHLTMPVQAQLFQSMVPDDLLPPDEARESQWSRPLLRLCLWSRARVSVGDAYLWQWALTEAGLEEGLDAVAVAAAAAAATAVVDLTPEKPCVSCAEVAEPDREQSASVDHVESYDEALSQLMMTVSELTEAAAGAQESAERIASAVAAATRPDDTDLEVISKLAASFDTSLAAFPELGLPQPAARVDAIEAAAEDAATRVGDGVLRTELRAVLGLRAVAGSVAEPLLGEAQRHTRELLADVSWLQDHRQRAEAMTALLGLIRMNGQGVDPQALFALQGSWMAGFPELAQLAVCIPLLSEQGALAEEATAPLDVASQRRPEGSMQGIVPVPAAVLDDRVVPDPGPLLAAGGIGSEEEVPAAPVLVADNNLGNVVNAPTSELVVAPPAETRPVSTELPGKEAGTVIEDPAVEVVVALLPAQRYGLAAHVASVAGWPEQRQAALRIAAYAYDLRNEAGGCAAGLSKEMSELDAEAVAVDWPTAALVVPAVIRAALITGEHTAGALLHTLAPRLEENFGTFAREVADRALSGALLHCPPLTVVEDVAATERELERARAACRDALRKPAGFRFPRAGGIAKKWLAKDGLLGAILSKAAADERDALPELVDAVHRLLRPDVIRVELDTMDRELMNPGGKPLEGRSRQDLLRLVSTRLQPVEHWIAAARALPKIRSQDLGWSRGEVSALRAGAMQRKDAALAAMSRRAAQEVDPLSRAACQAALASLQLTFALLAGHERLSADERPPGLVLDSELLKVPGTRVSAGIYEIHLPPTTLADLAAAAVRTWPEAVRRQMAGEHYDTVDYLLDCAKRQLLDPATGAEAEMIFEELRRESRAARQRSTDALASIHEALDADLRQARLHNAVSSDQERELDRCLQATAGLERGDLGAVRAELGDVAGKLKEHWARWEGVLRARLDALRAVDATALKKVERELAAGQFGDAEVMIAQLEADGVLAQIGGRRELDIFFPRVPETLPKGITRDLVAVVRSRGCVEGLPELDYSQLSEENAERAAEALDNWSAMGRRAAAQRQQGLKESELLMPALRLIGYSSLRSPLRRDDLRKGSDYRFLDLPDVRSTGDAHVPAFGSELGRRLRIMLVWGQPAPELLLSYADHDSGRESLLVAYFGTMSTRDRAALAVHCVGRRPIVVLDDAALVYLAAHGKRGLDTAMSILLPFSGVNPYISQKRGRVAKEMFFGREGEVNALQDPKGTQVVFGGRGLGKSALLKEVGQAFEKAGTANGTDQISLLLSLDSVDFRGSATSATVWQEISRKLEGRGITLPKRTRSTSGITHAQVQDAIQIWLREDDRRRLLILLDEADKFFDCDSPEFLETRRLRDLGQEDDGRVKVVFAGLHSVQRYAKVARNSPFSHLAQQPTVVGPLDPQDAANLLGTPLAVLGYRFEEDNLVHRILGYCSYQPFLLQMFGHRLVETMHKRRAEENCGTPPFIITRADVQAVHGDTGLRQGITSAFRDTLMLDHRYNVIANVLAYHAHERGIQSRMSQSELRDECVSWWRAGFSGLDAEAFRAYLAEMEGLGVLAPDTGLGWHLRSTNALSMIGNVGEVESQLINAEHGIVPEEFAALEARPRLGEDSYAPLTTSQVADVLGGDGNQVRVVIGSTATGVEHVTPALRDLTFRASGWVVPSIRNRGDFARELSAGMASDKRVVLDDLTVKSPNSAACLVSVEAALHQVPTASGVMRSVVIVAGQGQLSLWRDLLSGRIQDSSLDVVVLRRYSRNGLRAWALEQQRFTDSEHLEHLVQATGGWPVLVEQIAERLREGLTERKALARFRERLAKPSEWRTFVEAVGLGEGRELSAAYTSIQRYMGSSGLNRGELVDAVAEVLGDETARESVECLRAMQVFEESSPGRFSLEPVLDSCWRQLYE